VFVFSRFPRIITRIQHLLRFAAIRDRIKSVNNTRKITLAMKLVAAAKVRRAQDAVVATRPFSETLQSVFGGLITRLGGKCFC